MSDAPKHAPLPEVLAKAREIVNSNGRRGAIGVSVSHLVGMAHALCALHDSAVSAAEMLAAGERMYRAGKAGNAPAEQAADDDRQHHENELTDGLIALGLLTLVTQETNDERAD
ncbi:hypothetical protein EJV44_04535 [Ancylobacter aquaticus]|nr:hypothetical protein EJV44_04535 [Ancylobacter aquaticus]